jgi:hypothetical protein
MRAIYVAGYGRSGSTLLGRVLAAEEQAVAVGEVKKVDSRVVLAGAVCACGCDFPTCGYWREVDRRLSDVSHPSALPSDRLRFLEGYLGLLVPMTVLRPLARRCAFSDRYPAVSLPVGVRTMIQVSGSAIVDISKTTRTTANRPRLLAATGVEIDLYVSSRSLRDTIRSHREARTRRGRGQGVWWQSAAIVTVNRFLAHLAARWCARSLRVPISRRTLDETRAMAAEMPSSGDSFNHMIAGNRSRHLPRSRGASPPGD